MEHEPCLQEGKRPSIRKLSGPDGAEAWCVALGACFINFVMAGLARMSGILFVAFIDIFHIGRQEASLPSSIRMSTRNLLGPVVGILGQKYGVRAVALLGAIVGSFSAATCFFTTEFTWITLVWGIVSGAGSAMLTTLPQVVIAQHFKKYKTTAAGIAFSGGCIGSFFFPALLEFLLHTYGLNGTFLLISGIMMHTIPAAMILRKPTWMRESFNNVKVFTVGRPSVADKKAIQQDICPVQIVNSSSQQASLCGSDKTSQGNLMKSINSGQLRNSIDTVVEILKRGLETNESFPKSSLLDVEAINENLKKEVEEILKEIEVIQSRENAKIIEWSGVFFAINDSYHSHKDFDLSSNYCQSDSQSNLKILSATLALESIAKSDEHTILNHFPEDRHQLVSSLILDLRRIFLALEESRNRRVSPSSAGEKTISDTKGPLEKSDQSNTFLSHIRTALRLYLKPMYILICLCRIVHFVMLVTLLTTVVDFAMDKGLQEKDGKYVIAALSAGDLMGRLCLGWVTDKEYVSVPRYMLLVMIAQGASSIALSFMESRISLMANLVVFGLLQGSVFVRQPVLVSTYLGSQEQSIAMGSINFVPGLLGFTFPSYIGFFRDTIGSYDGIFYVNGGIGIFVGMLWAFEPYLRRFSKPDGTIMDRASAV